jgi:hypothetical protein
MCALAQSLDSNFADRPALSEVVLLSLGTGTSLTATVTFALDKESQELYIQVIDKETGEVLREIPPVEMRRLATSLKSAI